MAPEVVLGRPADAASDIFSLGVVAYEMVTGRRPFGGSSITAIIHNIVRTNPRAAHDVNLRLPTEYDAVFDRVLAKDPGARYAKASDFASALARHSWEEQPGLSSGAGETGAYSANQVDPGAQTMLTVEAGEIGATTIQRGADTDEIPETSLEPVEEEAPLGSLLETKPPPPKTLAGPTTTTQPAGPDLGTLARRVAAGGLGASDVLAGDAKTVIMAPMAVPPAPGSPQSASTPAPVAPPPAGKAPTAPMPAPPIPASAKGPGARIEKPAPTTNIKSMLPAPTQKGMPLGLILGATLFVVLAVAGGLSYLAYRWLVQRAATLSPRATPAAESTLEAAPATLVAPETTEAPTEPPPVPPTTLAEAFPAPETMPPAPAAPATAALSISSEPPGARVSIGRTPRGSTPLRLRLPPGPLAVTLEKDGFKPWKQDIALTAAGLSLEARLEPLPRETVAPKPASPPTPPRKLWGRAPELPPTTGKLKPAGSVLVAFVVDEEGRVIDPRVVDGGGAALDAACMDAVKSWRYEPATTQGVKVKVAQRAKFTFQAR
jgi:serine/threonine-protein kinase